MKRRIIFLILLVICLVSCSNKTVLEEYTGEYFDYSDYYTYLHYHGFVVDSMKSKDNFYTYTIGDNEYELIVLNNIKYSLKAYPLNLLFKDKEGSINLYDKYYVFDNLLLSKNTDKRIVECLKKSPIKKMELDYYKDGKIFTIDEFLEYLSLDVESAEEFSDDTILNAYKCVKIIFKDGSNILLKQIDEDYLDVVRNNVDDKLVMLHDTGCVSDLYCINDDDYIWIQNLMVKIVKDNGGIEAKFRSMNY